jgi:membrane protease YdiL (CAAX protease family)
MAQRKTTARTPQARRQTLDKPHPDHSKSAPLKRFLQSEVGAALLWVLGAILLAAVITPWLYQGGKWLAATAEVRELPALLESVAGSCGRAEIDRYYDRALLISALLLLPFLRRRIKQSRLETHAGPDRRRRYPWQSIAAQLVIGCVIAGGLLWAMGMLLEAVGAYDAKPTPPRAGKIISKVVVPAITAPLLEEWLFRGILLGLWLRFAKPAAACIGTSLVFAFVHFLEPAKDAVIANPSHPLAGFQLVGKILAHFADPLFFSTEFAVLFGIGWILAWARVRTGALWFSIGLHAGWVAAFKTYNLMHTDVAAHALRPWGIGSSLSSGLLPLLLLGITAIVCHFVMRRFPEGGLSHASR